MNELCPNCNAPGFTLGGRCLNCGYSVAGPFSAVGIRSSGDIARGLPSGSILLGAAPEGATVVFPGSSFLRHDIAALRFADELVRGSDAGPGQLAIFTTHRPLEFDFDLSGFLAQANQTDSILLLTDAPPTESRWVERSVPEGLMQVADDVRAYEAVPEAALEAAPTTRGGGGAETNSSLGKGQGGVGEGPAEQPVPAEVARVLEGRAPQEATPGKEVSVRVRVAQGERAGAVELSNLPHIPAEGLDVTLFLDAPGFTPSHLRETLRVPASGDSEWKLFGLVPKSVGSLDVEIGAFAGSQFLGTLHLPMAVVDQAPSDELVESRADVAARATEAGDAVLIVRYDKATQTYRYQWQEDLLTIEDEVAGTPLLQTPKDAVEGLVRELNKLARKNPYTDTQTRKWLRGKGIELWDQFIPEPLKAHFWDRIGHVKRLVIMTTGDPVPWELLYPAAPGQDIGFLVEAVPVVRWRFGGAPPRLLPLGDGRFVLPPESPPSAGQEIAALRGRLSGSGIQSGADVATLDDLLQLLDAPPGVLHFACHNTFSADAGGSRVAFGSAPFEPTFLREYKRNPWQGRPMVFMNACRTGGQEPIYTSLGGWAEAFLDAGAGTFIGSLWEVRDTSAREFAEAFYGALLGRKNLGEALQEARTAIRDRPGDPTWLAYTVYGDPAAARS